LRDYIYLTSVGGCGASAYATLSKTLSGEKCYHKNIFLGRKISKLGDHPKLGAKAWAWGLQAVVRRKYQSLKGS